ncbi:MAG: hypothetical protein JKY53_00630 [Flavobacteriales bacterium]|nr:hypothetical protein [Flavobacteriales bacterium]
MKTIIYRFLVAAVLSLCTFVGYAQTDTTQIRIVGSVYDPNTSGLNFNIMVINNTTGVGTYGGEDGSFNIVAAKRDTILLSTRNYKLIKLCFKDSAKKEVYNVSLALSVLKFEIKPVTIFAPRDLSDIKKDIDDLGYDKNDYVLSGIDVISSPITFLYQALSRKEQQKRLAYELINESKRRDLLKELFVKYVQHDIIDLEYDQFDNFIDFCKIADTQLQKMSQYDFIMYIKERYRIFVIVTGSDYYYDRD